MERVPPSPYLVCKVQIDKGLSLELSLDFGLGWESAGVGLGCLEGKFVKLRAMVPGKHNA